MPKSDRSLSTGPRAWSWKWVKPAVGLVAISTCVILLIVSARRGVDPAKIRRQANQDARAGRWNEAKSQLDQLNDPNPADRLLLAIVAHNLSRPDIAEKALQDIPDQGPLAAQASLWKGRIALSRFRAVPMEEALRRALAIDPKLVEARRLLVYLYGTQDRRVDLLEQFAVLAEIAPLTFDLVSHWCISHNDIFNDPLNLREDLKKFVAADPDDRRSRMALAMNERKLGRHDQAIAILETLPLSDADALACRVEIAFDRGDYQAAGKWLDQGPRSHPQLARQRGRLATKQGDRETALQNYRLSDSLEPNHWETIYGLSQSLPQDDPAVVELQGRRQSQRKLEEMLTTIKQNTVPKIQVCRKLGALCETSLYLPEARAWYRLAIKLDPLDRESQRALVRLNAEMSRNEARKANGKIERP